MKINLKGLFILVSFCVSEILPFFPKLESNGVVHGFIKLMKKTNPKIKHDCNTHPPVESIDTSIKKIVPIFKKNPQKIEEKNKKIEEKKTIIKYSIINDIDKNTKFSLNLRVFRK